VEKILPSGKGLVRIHKTSLLCLPSTNARDALTDGRLLASQRDPALST